MVQFKESRTSGNFTWIEIEGTSKVLQGPMIYAAAESTVTAGAPLFVFLSLSSGRAGGVEIVCSDHLNEWCADKAEVIKKGEDAPAIWLSPEVMPSSRETISVVVPYMPTLNTYLNVYITPVSLHHPRQARVEFSSGDAKKLGVSYIGLLNEGEGLDVLRDMIDSALALKLVDVRCKFTHHSLQAEQAWRELILKSGARAPAHKINLLLSYGLCNPCYAEAIKLARTMNISVEDLLG